MEIRYVVLNLDLRKTALTSKAKHRDMEEGERRIRHLFIRGILKKSNTVLLPIETLCILLPI